MKIMHLTKKYPDALGGDAVVVSQLERQQRAAGNDIIVLTSNCPEIRKAGYIHTFGLSDSAAALDNITAKRLVSLVALIFKSFSVLRSERPAVIHSHSIDMAFAASFAARWYRIPMVHTFHIVTFYDKDQSQLRQKMELVLARWSHLAAITAPNSFDVAQLQAAGCRQAVLLPNGIDMEYWKPVAPAQPTNHSAATGGSQAQGASERHNTPFTFVSASRLETQKGVEYLVRAAALLRQSTSRPFRVVIVGEGSLQPKLRGLIETLDMQDTVVLTGRKSVD
jgi:glycosyltransferase involved in cell wall biosynthesis